MPKCRNLHKLSECHPFECISHGDSKYIHDIFYQIWLFLNLLSELAFRVESIKVKQNIVYFSVQLLHRQSTLEKKYDRVPKSRRNKSKCLMELTLCLQLLSLVWNSSVSELWFNITCSAAFSFSWRKRQKKQCL